MSVGNPARGRVRRAGFGFMEAPRGALGHWIVIKNRKIENYQMVVPTTWNASPRDGNGHRRVHTRPPCSTTRWPKPD